MDGEHLLQDNTRLVIHGLNKVKILGKGQWVDGFHWSVMESTVVIKCTNVDGNGISIYNTKIVHIKGITITDCNEGISINSGSHVYLNNLSLQNNSLTGLFIYSTSSVTVTNSSFSLNTYHGVIIKLTFLTVTESNFSFSNATDTVDYGGLYVKVVNNSISKIQIHDSLFYKNVGGYAGGVCLVLQNTTTHVIIENSSFIDNYGKIGGLYVQVNNVSAVVTINQTLFLNNIGMYIGGAYLNGDNSDLPIIFSFNQTTFTNNSGSLGGLFVVRYGLGCTQIDIVDTMFLNNIGDGATISIFYGGCKCSKHITLQNTIFSNNSVVNPLSSSLWIEGNVDVRLVNVTIENHHYYISQPVSSNGNAAVKIICENRRQIVYITNLTIVDNKLTGLGIKKCYINFEHMSSTLANNNSPLNGGGIYLDDDATLASTVTVYFINNTAQHKGGAIFSTAVLAKKLYQQVQYYNVPFHMIGCTYRNFKVSFDNNYAKIAGNDIYGGRYLQLLSPTFDFKDIITCSHNYSYDNNDNLCFPDTDTMPRISSDPVGVCVCSNYHINCTKRVLHLKVYPAQRFDLPLVTVGLCGGISPGVIVTQGMGVIVLLGEANQQTQRHCKNFTYQLQQTMTSNQTAFTIKTDIDQSFDIDESTLTINVTFLPCPLGLQSHNSTGECTCNDIISSLQPQCNVSWLPYPIKRFGNNWFSFNQEFNCIISYTNCPFDYCDRSLVSLSLNMSDTQCTNNRSGTLCGQCQSGHSLILGSNKCVICSNTYLSLLVPLLIAGIILVVFLLILNMTVSFGSINGLLFYANIIKLNETMLFPNGDVPVLTQFIAWLNLDLGIETCFFDGLDAYWKAWLQFAFPLYIWLLIAAIVIGCHYNGKLSRFFGNNAVPVLATLILMSYTKILRNITNNLMMSNVVCENYQWMVWSADGNINYFHGKHIPLACMSLVFLCIGLFYTGLIFISQWLQRYSGKCCKSSRDPVVKLKPFIDAYDGPFKDKYRYWSGLLLIIRTILSALFSYTTGDKVLANNYIIIMVVWFLILTGNGVYKDKRLNVLELFFYVNLGMMSLLNALSDHMELSISTIVNIISVSMSLVVFICIVMAHVYIIVKKKWKINFESCNRRQVFNEDSETSDNNLIMFSPSQIINRRESLIFDLDIDFNTQ